MMDSQENTLEQGKVGTEETRPVEEKQQTVEAASEVNEQPAVSPAVEEAVAEEQSAVEEAAPAEQILSEEEPAGEDASSAGESVRHIYTSKAEVLERAKEIAQSEDHPSRDEVEHLKSSFYRLCQAERDQALKDYLAQGGDPDGYQILPDDVEQAFKAEMQIIKEKRARIFQEQEAEKESNLKRKLEIIDRIKAMATSPDQANKSFQEFKQLQQEWKEIKNVPAQQASELWRNYQLQVENYYDLLNLNREAREYDFKRNLEIKTHLCEEAEKLAEETDVVSAFHQLQDLHQQYRETGPVAKELREQIWTRFKAASTVINKKHQQHFEELRAKETDNLNRKTVLCEKAEAVAKEENKGVGDWDKHTKQIIELQKEWKTIGFAPQKMNDKIFQRFRAACDDFFGRKGEFFKTLKETYAKNIEKKKALIEKAKALQDSTEWRSTADKLIALQKEWKTVGVVPHKTGDQLWAEFLGACNHFFEARKAAHAGTHSEEHTNLEQKRDIITRMKALADETADDAQEKIQALVDEYNKVGHVPYKEKDKVYKEFHDTLNELYTKLHISINNRRLDNFKQSLKSVAKRGDDAVDTERGRLVRRYEQLKQELATFENNLGFLSIASKKGNSLVGEMNRRAQKLKDDIELIRQKIKIIDDGGAE